MDLNTIDNFSGFFTQSGGLQPELLSAISGFDYSDYDLTANNAQDGLGSNSISNSSNFSSISSLGFNSDQFNQSIPGLTLDFETHMNSDQESIQNESLEFEAKPTTSGFEIGCYNGDNGAGWIAFVLFNFLAMFIIPLLVSFLCYYSKFLFLINEIKRLIFLFFELVRPI